MIGYCRRDEDDLVRYAEENGIKLTKIMHDPDGSQLNYTMNGYGYKQDLLVYNWREISRDALIYWYKYYRLGLLGIKLTAAIMPKETERNLAYKKFAEYIATHDKSERYAHVVKKKKAAKQYLLGMECYGYMVFKGKLVPEPKEASHVKRLFELKALKLKNVQIAKVLNDEGRRYRNHRKWKEKDVKNLYARRRYYAGYILVDDHYEKGLHRPLIGEEWMN